MRRTVGLGVACATFLVVALSASAATSYVARLGVHGASRWTPNASLYVNLKAMPPGVWKQQLWSGTCAAPTSRIAVLRSVVVTSTRTLAKTTVIGSIPVAPDAGVVLRLSQGTVVICGSFIARFAPPPPPGASASASASAAPTASVTASPTETTAPPPMPSYSYGYPY